MKTTFDELPQWTFEMDEVSANVYEVIGVDKLGHRVQVKGLDLDILLQNARDLAKKIEDEIPKN